MCLLKRKKKYLGTYMARRMNHGKRRSHAEYGERLQTCAFDNGNRARSSGYVLAIGHRTAVWLGGASEARVPIADRLGSLNLATVFRSRFTAPSLSPDEPDVYVFASSLSVIPPQTFLFALSWPFLFSVSQLYMTCVLKTPVWQYVSDFFLLLRMAYTVIWLDFCILIIYYTYY